MDKGLGPAGKTKGLKPIHFCSQEDIAKHFALKRKQVTEHQEEELWKKIKESKKGKGNLKKSEMMLNLMVKKIAMILQLSECILKTTMKDK